MAVLTKTDSGRQVARKAIPADVRDEYQRLFGPAWEAKLRLPGTVSQAEARVRVMEWQAEVEARIEAIRSRQRGEGQALTPKQARALAGEWYTWFTTQYEAAPGTSEHWQLAFDELVQEIQDLLDPETIERGNLETWLREPHVLAGIRPMVADGARSAQFLASTGNVLTPEARDLFLDCVAVDYIEALDLLIRRAKGDYSPDPRPRQFPKFTRAKDVVHPWSLFEQWVAARQPAASTVLRWRIVLLALDAKFPDANAITEDQAHHWIRSLVGGGRSARTVRDTWLAASSRIFRYGVDEKLIRKNPFTSVKVTVPKKKKLREKAFTTAEAETILKAALAIDWRTGMAASAKRWVPWLCAYSGARAGEICQLRGQDVRQVDGVWAMTLTPEAGTVKTGEARTVPLHEHLIEQGFLEFVKARGKGPLFYRPSTNKVEIDPLKPRSSKAEILRVALAAWTRSIGIADKGVSPNHSWRHTFKKIADKAGISERTSDAITGHAPTTAGRGYGRADVLDMADALAKFPRYAL